MNFQHINVKVFLQGELPFEAARFIDLFHKWIREEAFDELLIDVADYRHVPDGPGVILIGHEADYSVDFTDGRCGLRYNCKAPVDGTNQDRLGQALRSALTTCQMLEEAFAADGPLVFSRDEFEVFVNDRAIGPNSTEATDAFRAEVDMCLRSSFGQERFKLTPPTDTRHRLGFTVKLAEAFDLAAVLGKLKPGA